MSFLSVQIGLDRVAQLPRYQLQNFFYKKKFLVSTSEPYAPFYENRFPRRLSNTDRISAFNLVCFGKEHSYYVSQGAINFIPYKATTYPLASQLVSVPTDNLL